MTKLLLLSFTIISLVANGQNNVKTEETRINEQDSVAYVQKCVSFIKQVKGIKFLESFFILSDKPYVFENLDCLSSLRNDTTNFSKEDIVFIQNGKYPPISKWTKKMFPSVKVISNDTIKTIFKDGPRQWAYFYKNIGTSYHGFSVPLFLRNDTYCLFYSDESCGGLCGSGSLILYKKENNKWIRIQSYCEWIS